MAGVARLQGATEQSEFLRIPRSRLNPVEETHSNVRVVATSGRVTRKQSIAGHSFQQLMFELQKPAGLADLSPCCFVEIDPMFQTLFSGSLFNLAGHQNLTTGVDGSRAFDKVNEACDFREECVSGAEETAINDD